MSHFTKVTIKADTALIKSEIISDSSFIQIRENYFRWDAASDPDKNILKVPSVVGYMYVDTQELQLSGDADHLHLLQSKLNLLQVISKIKANPNYQQVKIVGDGLEVIDWAGNKTRIKLISEGVEIEPVMAGDGCLSATASLEASLGQVTERNFKDQDPSSTRLFV